MRSRAKSGGARATPLLGPNAEAVAALVRLPRDRLIAAAEARGLPVGARATRREIAHALATYSARAKAEVAYRETGTSFDSRASAYPAIRRACQRAQVTQCLDIGCGPGFFAEELARGGGLPMTGSYVGVDISPAAIDLARARFVSDPRFEFMVGDADHVSVPRRPAGREFDGVVLAFVITYLDTKAVARLFATLRRKAPRARAVVALTFRSAVDAIGDSAPDLEAEMAYLAGDHKQARGRWDLRRFESYRSSFRANYRLVQSAVLDSAQLIWTGTPRRA